MYVSSWSNLACMLAYEQVESGVQRMKMVNLYLAVEHFHLYVSLSGGLGGIANQSRLWTMPL